MVDKDKRQKRFQQKKRHIDRQYGIWNSYMNRDGKWQRQPHTFHKVHALNCGDSKCAMCGNPRKFFGEKTMQELKFECEANVLTRHIPL